MMKRRVFVVRLAGLTAMGMMGDQVWAQPTRWRSAPTPITVYKSTTCGCCKAWVEHLEANGFSPLAQDGGEMDRVRDSLGVPEGVGSCHTAQLNGYLIEGHVPAADIRRLLAERPKTAGLAVP